MLVNGTKTAGLATRTAETLRARGYRTVTLGATGGGRLTTEIGYAPDSRLAAEQLAALFPGARLTADTGIEGVVVTLGADYRLDAGTAAAAPDAPSAGATVIPPGITDNARNATTDPCADLTFG